MREMKNSGVEWIGYIPKNWSITKIKYFYDCYDGRRVPVDAARRSRGPYPYWGAGSITDYVDQYLFDEELVLLGEDGAPFFDYTRPVAFLINEKIWVNNHIHVLKPKVSVNSRFFVHWLNNVDYRSYINGSILNKLTQSNMDNIAFAAPPLEEQRIIADFLDTECARIDAVIEQTRASIEEYKKLKQSVITQAVTKGILPNRPMKDSGIEWIGEIPENWQVRRIKTLFQLRDEKNYLPLEEVNLISLYTDKGVVQHCDLEQTTGNKASTADGYKKVYENDIVVNIILCWMGAIGRSAYTGVTSPAYDIYIPSDDIECRFYHHYFRTKGFSGDCYKRGKGIMAMRWRTYSDQFRDIPVVMPPKEEQQEILTYLDAKTVEIEKLIAKKEEFLAEMESYKKSVIFEYVTGKKEV